jgi:hypothetical protein
MMIEGTLLEKLRKIEALHAGTTVDGEREAARRVAARIRARLAELRAREQDEVLIYALPDPWKRKLLWRFADGTDLCRIANPLPARPAGASATRAPPRRRGRARAAPQPLRSPPTAALQRAAATETTRPARSPKATA